VLVALLVLLVIGAGAAFALNQDDSTPEAKPTTPSTEKPADTSTSTSTTTTARPATTTTAAPVTTVPPATAPEGDETIPGSPKAVARAYFGALSRGDFDAAYAMGSPDFQSKTDKTVYVNFWSAHRPTIVGPLRVSGNGDFRTVSFRLDTGGHQENYNLELVQIGGRWLINGPTPKSNN
jgi:hypothetical protein